MSGWSPVIALVAATGLTVAGLMRTVFCLEGMAIGKPTRAHVLITWLPLAVPLAAWTWAAMSVARVLRP